MCCVSPSMHVSVGIPTLNICIDYRLVGLGHIRNFRREVFQKSEKSMNFRCFPNIFEQIMFFHTSASMCVGSSEPNVDFVHFCMSLSSFIEICHWFNALEQHTQCSTCNVGVGVWVRYLPEAHTRTRVRVGYLPHVRTLKRVRVYGVW